jgi:hypothetical protein
VQHKKYTFSFTGASALIAETFIIAEEYDKLKDWKEVKKSLNENNLLNKVKQTTFNREFSEIKKRLSLLTPAQLKLLIYGGSDDAKAMILLSLTKAYPYLKDFIIEVLRNKFLLFDRVLTVGDYMRFFEIKSLQHPELSSITEVTAKKVKQVAFKLLAQVGLITHIKDGLIIRPVLSSQVLKVIIEEDAQWLTCFLYSNEEARELSQK